MRLYVDGDKIITPNTVFTLYFTLMFCLYTNTYVQLIAQIMLIAYVLMPLLKRGYVRKSEISNLPFYIGWYGAFTVLMFLSRGWAYSVYSGSKTLITVFRICIMGFVIFIYANSKERVISIMQSFIIACSVMGVMALFTTILSGGTIGTTSFGVAIGQHRNQIGAVAAPLSVLCAYLKKYWNMKYGNLLCVYFLFLTVCTGSRTSILQIIVIYAICILLEKDAKVAIKKIALAVLGMIVVVVLVQSIPYLYDMIWLRIQNAINTVLGKDSSDTSAMGRDFYKAIAFIMFKQKPWIGYGVDGFVCFLRDHPTIMGVYMKPVYSHCNYSELAADFGIVGLLLWYIPIVRIFYWGWQTKSSGYIEGGIYAIFVSIVISDYSRFPWDTHLSMYLLFIIVLLIRFDFLDKKRGNT